MSDETDKYTSLTKLIEDKHWTNLFRQVYGYTVERAIELFGDNNQKFIDGVLSDLALISKFRKSVHQ